MEYSSVLRCSELRLTLELGCPDLQASMSDCEDILGRRSALAKTLTEDKIAAVHSHSLLNPERVVEAHRP